MAHKQYKTRKEAFAQLNRLVGTWVDDGGSESMYEWMPGGNFMVHKVGKNAASGLEIIGYDAKSGLLKSSFYASDEDMLDNGGRPINYIHNFDGENYETALDMPDRHGSFTGKLTDNDTKLSGRWDWVQNGEKMGYESTSIKQ